MIDMVLSGLLSWRIKLSHYRLLFTLLPSVWSYLHLPLSSLSRYVPVMQAFLLFLQPAESLSPSDAFLGLLHSHSVLLKFLLTALHKACSFPSVRFLPKYYLLGVPFPDLPTFLGDLTCAFPFLFMILFSSTYLLYHIIQYNINICNSMVFNVCLYEARFGLLFWCILSILVPVTS